LGENLDIELDKRRRNIYSLLTEYYSQEDGKISYEYFINRMSFWMTTGSGKTLIIIKFIQILNDLIKSGEIPPYDNLSDEQKEKIIDLRNYDNDGKWYIFLDEAHKGDREESKRQHIYSILSFRTPVSGKIQGCPFPRCFPTLRLSSTFILVPGSVEFVLLGHL